MNRPCIVLLGPMATAALCLSLLAREHEPVAMTDDLPPLETFVLQPVAVDDVCLWVPADKAGPVINRSCGLHRNCVYSCLLPAGVEHAKTGNCPPEVARLLAERVARCHEQSLPLTIFNGWQWEYSYSLCQFESVLYDLDPRGGSWEISLEAVLTQTLGSLAGRWMQVSAKDESPRDTRAAAPRSHIEVTAFDSVRIRDGYPKKRQL